MKTLFRITFIAIIAYTTQGCGLLAAGGIGSQAQPVKEVQPPLTSTTANSAVNVNHSEWNGLLKKHVNAAGLVDYNGFQEDRAALTSYLDMLAAQDPSNDWSVQELLAYYINLYNAVTVELILQNPDVESIKDIDGPWTKGRARVDGRELTLAGIENGILRKMNEPRIHFAINCASISCPPLLREAYTAGKINEQLDRATREFINSDKNTLSPQNPQVSSLFDWYKKDYITNQHNTVIDFINAYADTKINPDATLQFKNYDWGLNDQK